MRLNLPVLTDDIDCGPIGYPGIVVKVRLNPGFEPDDAFPWDSIEDPKEKAKAREAAIKAEPWQSEFFYRLGRILESITLPPGTAIPTEDGYGEVEGFDTQADLVWNLPDARAVFELWSSPGFDHEIFTWLGGQYTASRVERLAAQVKN